MSSTITNIPSPETSGEPDPGIVENYKTHLQALGYSPGMFGKCIRTILHLISWLSANGTGIESLDIRVLNRFLNHGCACPGPHGYRKNRERARWHLHRFLGFLMETGRVRMPLEIESGGRVVESFLQALVARGHVSDSIAAYRKRCRHFIVWLYLHDAALAEIDDDVLSRFLAHDCTCVHPHFFNRSGRFAGRNNSRSKIGLFIDYLTSTGIAPPRPKPACEEPGQYLARFLVWLRRHRGIGDGTIQSHHKVMRVLLPHLGDDPDRYSATLIRNTVRTRLEAASRDLVRRETSALRLYLRFLVLEGLCHPGLVGAVPTVPTQRFSTLPRHLPREDIEQIIASCDRAAPMGMRDRAILLLLARLALRAGDVANLRLNDIDHEPPSPLFTSRHGDVANLRLNDIDWDNAVVRVSGKSRRAAVLPLPQDVGDAVKDYVLHARPVVDVEKVFLRMVPPRHQPLTSGGVSAVAQAAIKRSGVKAEGLPAGHVFRHSAATNLLRDGTPLEVVSTLLRHQSTQTTAIYARVDVRMLREVAQPWPVAGEEK